MCKGGKGADRKIENDPRNRDLIQMLEHKNQSVKERHPKYMYMQEPQKTWVWQIELCRRSQA